MNQHILEAFEYNQHLVAYLNIVNYWKSHEAEGNVERHHIVPRSFFKNADLPVDDSEDNIVTLPYEDHQKIHSLAVLCAREIIKASMKYAASLMNRKSMAGENNPMKDTGVRKKHFESTHTKEYQEMLHNRICWNKGKHDVYSAETLKKISEASRRKVMSAEARKKISEATKGENNPMFGKKRPEDWCRKHSEATRGKPKVPWTPERRAKYEATILARKAKQA